MITLPLKRAHQKRADVHPQVYLQQHLNRGLKRYARMTGNVQPSKRSLQNKLQKRMEATEPLIGRANRKRSHKVKKNNDKNVGAAATSSAVVSSATSVSSSASDNSTDTGSSSTAGNSSSSATTADGFPEIDLEAQTNGGLTVANTPTANNTLGLDIEANDVGYVATVQIGTPPQDFKFLMDTGSADMWVGSSDNCTTEGTSQGCGNHTFLGTNTSSSFAQIGKQFQVTYGTGQVAGVTVSDNVNIAGLALNNHTFGVANVESTDFSSDTVPFDGLMGLAQSTLSEEGVDTPPESLTSNGLIGQAIASFKISRLADQTNDGEVTFGGLDTSKFDQNSLVTVDNVSQEGFWEAAMDAVTADGQDLGLQNRSAILDIGTTLIVAPQTDADAVHAAIPGAQSDGQGGYTIPCTSNTSVALGFGGSSFAINPLDLLFTPVDANNLTGDCVSGISAGEIDGATTWLVGDVFLKNVYMSVNQNTNQISLATLV
ncbi:aspartic peptidase A1 [Daedalea quercina L-15889]|uniref:Aspartic peptidase A1 n=1 Tax=Daedalea quercina L-15889 TaxID=1314783 RepID=A0A165T995_9APHY|nr:aspartic peptidase A1 [Daedalea quercina L-15889]